MSVLRFETYAQRTVSKEEYVFWHQALNHRVSIPDYDWLRAPQEMRELADRTASFYNEVWVESNWPTGADPALFAKGETYLLARWETEEFSLRTESQIKNAYCREVESRAVRENRMFQGWFFIFETILLGSGILLLTKDDSIYEGIGFLTVAFLLEIGRRLHKKRGATRPNNVWEQQALNFVCSQSK